MTDQEQDLHPYRIRTLEVWEIGILLDAYNERDAIERYLNGEEGEREYVRPRRIVDPNEWIVESREPEKLFEEAIGLLMELSTDPECPEHILEFLKRIEEYADQRANASEMGDGSYSDRDTRDSDTGDTSANFSDWLSEAWGI